MIEYARPTKTPIKIMRHAPFSLPCFQYFSIGVLVYTVNPGFVHNVLCAVFSFCSFSTLRTSSHYSLHTILPGKKKDSLHARFI